MSGQALAHRATRHTDWCASGHRCGLGEHRGEPLRLDIEGVGSLVVTRVQGVDGHQYAEIRGSLRLDQREHRARGQLVRRPDAVACWPSGIGPWPDDPELPQEPGFLLRELGWRQDPGFHQVCQLCQFVSNRALVCGGPPRVLAA